MSENIDQHDPYSTMPYYGAQNDYRMLYQQPSAMIHLYNLPVNIEFTDLKELLQSIIGSEEVFQILNYIPNTNNVLISVMNSDTSYKLIDNLNGYEWFGSILNCETFKPYYYSSSNSNAASTNPPTPSSASSSPSLNSNQVMIPYYNSLPPPPQLSPYPNYMPNVRNNKRRSSMPLPMQTYTPYQVYPYYPHPAGPPPTAAHLPAPPNPQTPMMQNNYIYKNAIPSWKSYQLKNFDLKPYHQDSNINDGESSSSTLSRPMNGEASETDYENDDDVDVGDEEGIDLEMGQENVDFCRLFIGNIPFTSNWKSLKDFLKRSGVPILRVEIPTQLINGISKGFAIVITEKKSHSIKLIKQFNGVDFEGRPLTVRFDKFPEFNNYTIQRRNYNTNMNMISPMNQFNPGPRAPQNLSYYNYLNNGNYVNPNLNVNYGNDMFSYLRAGSQYSIPKDSQPEETDEDQKARDLINSIGSLKIN